MKILFFIFFVTILFADGLQYAQLQSVSSNTIQNFSIKMSHFALPPYGVITLEQMMADNKIALPCKQRIQSYFVAHPEQKEYALTHLHVRQIYAIELKKSKVILYAFGQKTFSEALLAEGLAVKEPNFEDDEFRYLFLKAQEGAKKNLLGLWSDEVMQTCVIGAYK